MLPRPPLDPSPDPFLSQVLWLLVAIALCCAVAAAICAYVGLTNLALVLAGLMAACGVIVVMIVTAEAL